MSYQATEGLNEVTPLERRRAKNCAVQPSILSGVEGEYRSKNEI